MSDVAVVAKPAAKPATKEAAVVEKPATPTGSVKRVLGRRHQLSIGDFKPAGHFKQTQQAMIHPDWAISELFDPDFWASIAPTFQSAEQGTGQNTLGTEIEVRTKDNSLFARLIVTAIRKNSLGQADGLYVECIGPACDPKTGVPCAYDLKARRPVIIAAAVDKVA